MAHRSGPATLVIRFMNRSSKARAISARMSGPHAALLATGGRLRPGDRLRLLSQALLMQSRERSLPHGQAVRRWRRALALDGLEARRALRGGQRAASPLRARASTASEASNRPARCLASSVSRAASFTASPITVYCSPATADAARRADWNSDRYGRGERPCSTFATTR
jgi:hypothetical protein